MEQSTIYEDGVYLANNPTWHEEDSPWKAQQILKMFAKHDMKPARVCEVGCGAGGILVALADALGSKVDFFGYDISPQAMAVARPKERPNLSFHLKNLLEETDAWFDVVMAIDVFEHVEDYFGFLRRMKTRGEYKVFHIPLDISVQSVFRNRSIMGLRESVGHIHYFTKDTALATLKDAGYEVVDWFYTNSALELSNKGWKAGLMKMPRKLSFALNRDFAARLLGGFSLLVLAK